MITFMVSQKQKNASKKIMKMQLSCRLVQKFYDLAVMMATGSSRSAWDLKRSSMPRASFIFLLTSNAVKVYDLCRGPSSQLCLAVSCALPAG